MEEMVGFYKDRKVLVTGHTGFKGSWICSVLKYLGADVTGYGLKPPTTPSMFELCDVADRMNSVIGDIRDLDKLHRVFDDVKPEIVIHMAAQPIVRKSYKNPVETYEINVMGTVNILECIRNCKSVRSVINVTTDKVYRNDGRDKGYTEDDFLNGYDPYSNSKSCSELVTSAYQNSFFSDNSSNRKCAISTCRAGNVIGGGDFAPDRIIPDCIRAVINDEDIVVRNPHSIRPYQHVLEPVIAYLYIAMSQYEDISLSGSYNIGPDDRDDYTTGDLVTLFCDKWKEITGNNITWVNKYDGGPHEDSFLMLDNALVKKVINWEPKWDVIYSMEKIIEWTWEYMNNRDIRGCTEEQIAKYIGHYNDRYT